MVYAFTEVSKQRIVSEQTAIQVDSKAKERLSLNLGSVCQIVQNSGKSNPGYGEWFLLGIYKQLTVYDRLGNWWYQTCVCQERVGRDQIRRVA